MNPDLYGLLAARARGRCECGCGASIPPGEADHQFGRARSEEVEATVWLLTPRCHYQKTNSIPSATHWLEKFIAHATRYGYHEARNRAEARRDFVNTRNKLLDDTKARAT